VLFSKLRTQPRKDTHPSYTKSHLVDSPGGRWHPEQLGLFFF